jgi:hypothetical protein
MMPECIRKIFTWLAVGAIVLGAIVHGATVVRLLVTAGAMVFGAIAHGDTAIINFYQINRKINYIYIYLRLKLETIGAVINGQASVR